MDPLVMASLLKLGAFAVEKAIMYSEGGLTTEEVEIYVLEMQAGMNLANDRANRLIAARRAQ
tara:strand:- start:7231 stop:7416 length:186 start_codon:yes stop_codon:yes gene_type:complete